MKTLHLIVLATVLLAAAGVAGWQTSTQARRERAIRDALFKELQPVALKNCTFKRYGGKNDGGYLMCANLLNTVESAYSYGIDREDNWGCQVSRELAVRVHQYDCFTEHRPACDGVKFFFHDECVGPRTETSNGQPFDTIPNQIQKNGDAGKDILLKIDVEGAEWASLMATPAAVLDRIVQMPMELHGANEQRFVDTIRKLKQTFYIVNLHYNNWACTGDLAPLRSHAYQVLLVNKRVGVLDPSVTPPAPSSPLNAPDNPKGSECSAPSP
jgi:hypothetical protein